MTSTALELRAVCKNFSSAGTVTEVLKEVDLILHSRESVAILGHSGSGKTTLLQIAGLLDVPTSGSVFIGGIDCSGKSEQQLTLIRRNMIGFVYQFHYLIPEMTALENVMLPMLIMRKNIIDARLEAERVLNSLGLYADKANRRPKELSGGENQRIAIARAFVKRPKILLADEPTGNLDEANASIVSDLLLQLAAEYSTASLVITHNENLAGKLDRFVRLYNKHLIDN